MRSSLGMARDGRAISSTAEETLLTPTLVSKRYTATWNIPDLPRAGPLHHGRRQAAGGDVRPRAHAWPAAFAARPGGGVSPGGDTGTGASCSSSWSSSARCCGAPCRASGAASWSTRTTPTGRGKPPPGPASTPPTQTGRGRPPLRQRPHPRRRSCCGRGNSGSRSSARHPPTGETPRKTA